MSTPNFHNLAVEIAGHATASLAVDMVVEDRCISRHPPPLITMSHMQQIVDDSRSGETSASDDCVTGCVCRHDWGSQRPPRLHRWQVCWRRRRCCQAHEVGGARQDGLGRSLGGTLPVHNVQDTSYWHWGCPKGPLGCKQSR